MITKVITKIASGKAAGPPWIAPEVRKPDSEAGAIEVREHIEDIISGGSIPTDWQERALHYQSVQGQIGKLWTKMGWSELKK